MIISAWAFETITQQAAVVTNKAALTMSSWSPVTWDHDSLLKPGLKMTTAMTEGNSNLLGETQTNYKLSSYFIASSAFARCDSSSFTAGLCGQESHSSPMHCAAVLVSAPTHCQRDPAL